MCAVALVVVALVPLWAQDTREALVGAQMAKELRKQMPIVKEPATRLYISELVSKLAGRDYPIDLEIIDSRSGGEPSEPLWIIGHYVFVPTALIRNARDESELAGMLAHTLAHEANHDSLRVDRGVGGIATIPLYAIGSEASFRMNIRIAQRNETLEIVADAVAAKSMQKSGYDPAALLRYVTREHGDEAERIAALEKSLQELQARPATVLDTSTFQRIQEKYPPPDKPRTSVPTLLR